MNKKNLIILTIIGVLILIGFVSTFVYFLKQREAETPPIPEAPVFTPEEPEAIKRGEGGAGELPPIK